MSEFLERVMNQNNGIAHLQVVFTDIVKYSLRNAPLQREIIQAYMNICRSAIAQMIAEHQAQFQSLGYEESDVIKIPTGDGLAIVFIVERLPSAHLLFADSLLKIVGATNSSIGCAEFHHKQWCACHAAFTIRIGMSSAPGLVYTDINDHYNVAGSVINLASRVMGVADGMQIMISSEDHGYLREMASNIDQMGEFKLWKGVSIKHSLNIDVYQFLPHNNAHVSVEIPQVVREKERVEQASKLMQESLHAKDSLLETQGDLIAELEKTVASERNRYEILAARLREFQTASVRVDLRDEHLTLGSDAASAARAHRAAGNPHLLYRCSQCDMLYLSKNELMVENLFGRTCMDCLWGDYSPPAAT
jgi:class 3 adenylate cyclase